MGEANARHLRGGEMDDIIFAGTANRPSRNLAEVALTIEEDEAALPPPFANHKEVHVVRRIERGGGSVYRVNGREARARDVQTLFADLASGARSSAMVSQGRVGMLVNARPEERRAVLEEAAGITGLHSRRSEAETRLRATEGNLERAEERRVLLARQADGLAVQATQAARYRLVIAGMQEAETTFLASPRGRALKARDDATTAVTAARSREAEAVAVAASERAKMALEGVTEELARAQAALANAERRKAQLASDLAHAEQILSDSETVDARLVAEFARLTDEIARHPALLQEALSAAERAAESLHVADRAATEAAAAASMTSAQTSAAQQLLQQAQARHQRAIQLRRRLDAEAQQADAGLVSKLRVAEAETNAAAANSALTEAREELAAAENARASAIRALASIREKFSREDVVRHRLAAEASALAEILSVKDGERWPPMIDSLTVPQGLEAALGAVLGEELAAAADPTAARHWRELPELSPRPLPGIGLAGQVTAPPMLARALGAIGLVQSEAEGDHAQAGLAPGQSIVSATGAVWRWDGYTVRAGTPTAATVRLQQRNRLVKLQSGLRDAEATVSATKQMLDTALQADQKAAAALDQARQRQRAGEIAAERARVSAQALNVQSEAGQARWRAIQEQLQQLQPELDAAETARQAAESAVAELPDSTVLKTAAETTRAAINVARQRDSAAAIVAAAAGS